MKTWDKRKRDSRIRQVNEACNWFRKGKDGDEEIVRQMKMNESELFQRTDMR
jgi:hypothetical protein